jgi:8-oxo-dGTP diphosphatase
MPPAPTLHTLPQLQLAAGGVVWRLIEGAPRLAVIHRPKYDDWTLPKGKPDPNETLPETAAREVREELGCGVRFLEFAGTIHYPRGEHQTKVVFFWHMVPLEEFIFHPNAEVDRVEWLTQAEALKKLDHQVEAELLRNCVPPPLPLKDLK